MARRERGIPLRALAPNAMTALALCSGLSAVRFGISENWDRAVLAIFVAAVLDGLDGRVARLLKGESRFGAELDSLSDMIAFGVSPAIIIYLWSLQTLPQAGWLFALAHAVCCAFRLARFNANLDVEWQPQKSAGFLTGVPAPAGAALLLLPLYLWSWTDQPIFREPYIVAPWAAFVAFLMVSSLPTFSWGALRVRRHIRMGALIAIALFGAALISAPWATLSVGVVAYVLMMPLSLRSYARVTRRRAAAALHAESPMQGAQS
jgi:CDP-diacylglycerol--serine O-phosphatidyltransferase